MRMIEEDEVGLKESQNTLETSNKWHRNETRGTGSVGKGLDSQLCHHRELYSEMDRVVTSLHRASYSWENEMKWWCFRPLLCTLFRAKLGQAGAGDNEAKLMTKLAPEWVRTSDPVIRSPALKWLITLTLNIKTDMIHCYLAPHRGRARYCNAHVCLCVCLSVFSQNFKV